MKLTHFNPYHGSQESRFHPLSNLYVTKHINTSDTDVKMYEDLTVFCKEKFQDLYRPAKLRME